MKAPLAVPTKVQQGSPPARLVVALSEARSRQCGELIGPHAAESGATPSSSIGPSQSQLVRSLVRGASGAEETGIPTRSARSHFQLDAHGVRGAPSNFRGGKEGDPILFFYSCSSPFFLFLFSFFLFHLQLDLSDRGCSVWIHTRKPWTPPWWAEISKIPLKWRPRRAISLSHLISSMRTIAPRARRSGPTIRAWFIDPSRTAS